MDFGEPVGFLFTCDRCDGPRHHISCRNKQAQADMSPSGNGPVCQWCSENFEYVFTADRVRMARIFVEGIGFHDDPENPDRKERAFNLLEFHEKSVPPEAVSSPKKFPDPESQIFPDCHILFDLCRITLGQALAHRSRM